MPRLRKSDAEKSARGTLQKCRSSKPYPVSGSVLSEEPPVGIPGDAKEVWALAVKNAPKGRHGALFDEEETTGRRKLSPEFQAMQILVGTLIKLEKELGFTPVSRAHAPAQEEELLEKNPFEA